jgi:hypothetical protein
MTNFLTSVYRDLTCVAAASLITLVVGMAFVQSTSVAPGSHSRPVAQVTSAPRAANS